MSAVPAPIPILRPRTPGAPSQTWVEHLQGRLRSPWMPGEWDEQTQVWTPSPANPDNCVSLCERPGCGVRNLHQGFCAPCASERLEKGWSDEDLMANPRPARFRRLPHQACTVADASGRCELDRDAGGLCTLHRRNFEYSEHTSVKEWLLAAAPAPHSFVACTIPQCRRSAEHGDGDARLCGLHHHAWRGARDEGVWDFGSWRLTVDAPQMLSYSIYFEGMGEVLRAELMVVIQDHVLFKSGRLHPGLLATVARKAKREALASLVDASDQFWEGVTPAIRVVILDTLLPLHRSWRRYDPWSEELLFLQDLGLRREGPRRTKTPAPAPLDLAAISQEWLREPFRHWVLLTRDRRRVCIQVYGLLLFVSRTLTEHDAALQHDMNRLDTGVMSVVVNAMHARWPLAHTLRHQLGWWWKITEFARRHELWNDIPRSFAQDPAVHRNRNAESEVSRPRLTRQAVEHIRNNLHAVTGPHDAMTRAMIALYIDTGRRPGEIAGLLEDCLIEHPNGDVDLIYDDTKTGRLHRSLVINQQTAEVIRSWRPERERLGIRSKWLFPAATTMNSKIDRHVTSQTAAHALRAAVLVIPNPTSAPAGNWLPTMGGNGMVLYDFRHAYAQRHADEGVDPDVLMDLMGHKTFRTTLGYYEISGERKRAAVLKIRPLVMDRTGSLTSTRGQRARLSTVAVPYGGCSEPSNVAAGGESCPIRFQCAGCTFYRPDPSYLPDIEHQQIKLKTELAAARHIGAADYVIRGYESEITSFDTVIGAMRGALEQLPDQERLEVEEASKTLRHARLANTARPLLPIRPVTSHD